MKPLLAIFGLLAALGAAGSPALGEDFAEKLRQAEAGQIQARPTAVPSPKAPLPKPKAAPSPPPTAVPTPAAAPTAAAAPEAALESRVAALEGFQKSLDRFKFEAFAHLRYDSQDSKKLRGLYARRVEAKAVAKLWDGANGIAGFDFAENKLKDLGVEWLGESWKLRLGQFRQNFGIEIQTGSPKTLFAERALIYGGIQATAASTKFVGERSMGLHALQSLKLGPLGLGLGLSLANNLSEDQAAGKNKIGAADAFAKQAVDENPSLASRFGAELSLGGMKVAAGASYARDNQNAAFLAARSIDQRYDEVLGLDLKADWPKRWTLQGEWAAANSLRGDLGLSLRREGYYVQQSLQPWRFFDEKAPALELLARYEGLLPDVYGAGIALDAATGGLKWTYGDGRQYLLFQYTAYGYQHDFGAAAGTELWVLQNQLFF